MLRLSSVALFLCLAVLYFPAQVLSHTYVSAVTLPGGATPTSTCLRVTATPETRNAPIMPVTSPNMMCGVNPQAATSKCTIAAGSEIGIQWVHESPTNFNDIMDASHKGPCMVYLSSDNGATWFKIYENGLDVATQTFCTTKLIADKGYMKATIPADIAPGNYLLRGEVIALHEAYDEGKAQPYPYCVELTITGSGTAKPAGVAFPGAYKPSDPGLKINIYGKLDSYTIPGPALYVAGATPAGPSPAGGDTPAPSDPAAPGGDNIQNSSAQKNGSSASSAAMPASAAAAIAVLVIAVVCLVSVIAVFSITGKIFGFRYDESSKSWTKNSGEYSYRSANNL